jgi:hypothetical protein
MTNRLGVARDFIVATALPDPPPISFSTPGDADNVPFQNAIPQASVVESSLVAFAADTQPSVRQAVSDSLLFAQLYADSQVPDRNNAREWLERYFAVLPNLGWLLGDDVGSEVEESTLGSVVHQRIMDLLAIVLGPVPTALAITLGALQALQSMSKDSPWLTLFNRRSKQATAAGVQVAHVETDDQGGATIRGSAFRVEAEQTITQVLFFKFTSNEAKLFRRTVSMTIDSRTLESLAPDLRARLAAYQHDFIKTLPLPINPLTP